MQRWHIFFFSSLLFSSVRMSFGRGRPTPSVDGQISNLRSRFLQISPYFARTTGGKGKHGTVLFYFSSFSGFKRKVKGVKETLISKLGHSLSPGVLYLSDCSRRGKKNSLHTFFWSCNLSHFPISPSSLTPQILSGISDLCVNLSASSWNPGPDLTASVTKQGWGSRSSLWVQKSPWKTPGLSIWTLASDKQTSTSSLCWRFRRETLTGGLLAIKLGGAHTQTHTPTRTRTQWSTSDFNKPQTFFQAINNKEFQPNRHCL